MDHSRRNFLKKSIFGGLSASVLPHVALADDDSSETSGKEAQSSQDVPPTPAQKEWMKLKFGMFIHFGINTYYDKEWSEGELDPSKYNPADLDTDQWCRVAKEAGMNYVILVCKHHDGFCNWPTAYTDYSVSSTPFKGDLVGEVVRSARKHGLKVGFYYSLWDCHEPTYEDDPYAYISFMKNQIKELLTNYGDIIELWFDGFWKKQQTGWKDKNGDRPPAEEFIKSWRYEGAYRWQMDHLYQYIKELQPNCLVMNNSTTSFPATPLHPVDIVSGERATEVTEYKRVWEWLGDKIYYPMQIETTMSREGNEKFPSGNWFWHSWDHSVVTREQINNWLNIAGKMNANLLLNVGPKANGKLREEDVEVLTSLQEG